MKLGYTVVNKKNFTKNQVSSSKMFEVINKKHFLMVAYLGYLKMRSYTPFCINPGRSLEQPTVWKSFKKSIQINIKISSIKSSSLVFTLLINILFSGIVIV